MAHSIYRWDYSGNLVEGIFYELNIPLNLSLEYPPSQRPPGTIVNDPAPSDWQERFVYGEVLFRMHPGPRCPLDASHEKGGIGSDESFAGHSLRYDHEMDLLGGAETLKFVCDTNGMTVVVNREFKNELSRSGLTGFSTCAPFDSGRSKSVEGLLAGVVLFDLRANRVLPKCQNRPTHPQRLPVLRLGDPWFAPRVNSSSGAVPSVLSASSSRRARAVAPVTSVSRRKAPGPGLRHRGR